MSQLGIGAMLYVLGGGSERDPRDYYGQPIVDASIDSESLTLKLGDGRVIAITDGGQSCCEHRYMSTDDDVKSLIGGTLTGIEGKEGPDVPYPEDDNWGETHETMFVEVRTDKGFITIVNHNEHNGYYGGFGINIVEKEPRSDV